MRRAVILVLFLLACGRKSDTATGGPPRIVSLTPSATEIVAALGVADQLVGVDTYSKYPPEVAALPKVGSFLAPNLEQIVELRPTLVIVDDIHGQAAGALADRGIETIACPMHTLPDVKQSLRRIGTRLGRSAQAEAAISEIDHALDAAAAARPARHPKVLPVIDREAGGLGNLVIAGPGSWVDELLAVVGGDNVLAASGVRYPKISVEEILRGQPDIIIDLSFPAQDDISVWKTVDVPAVRNGKVIALSHPFLQGPSPRVKQALDALAAAIR